MRVMVDHCGFPYFRDEPKHDSVERRCGEKVRTSLGILRTPFLALHDLYMRSEVWIPMLYFCKACIWHSPAPKKKGGAFFSPPRNHCHGIPETILK